MKGISSKCGIMAVFFVLMHAAPLLAQSIWTDSGFKKSISMELLLPSFKTLSGENINNQTAFLSMRMPIGSSRHFVIELPYSNGKIQSSNDDENESDNALGNIYIGYEEPTENCNILFELGIRLPTSPNDEVVSNLLGVFADFERFDAFIIDYLIIKPALNAYLKFSNSVQGRFRAAPSLWFNMSCKSGIYRDPFVILLNTSGQIWYENGKLSFGSGLSVISSIKSEALIFNKSSLQLGMSASYSFNNIKPGFYMRFPLENDLKDLVNHVIGLNIQWLIR